MSMVAAIDRLIQDRNMDKDPVIAAPPPRSPPYGLVKERRFYQDDMVGKTLNDKQALVAEGKSPATPAAATPRKLGTPSGYGEDFFFDAPESPFAGSETSSQCDYSGVETSTTLAEATADSAKHQQDMEELERYKKAEETLEIVLQKLADGGLAVPPTLLERNGGALEVEDLDIVGQLQIKKMVEAAVARGAAKAECEEQLQAELESKNTEIETKNREVTRLRDKVRYNELLNREISQRNQEAIEMARSKRRARKRMIRWAVGSASAAIVGGIGVALVYKYSSWEFLRASKPEATSE
ncbi:hypothetical protein SELMODRAFT_422224 [Selaginella moellendorffii]|uniref:Uncharacterized protein n=1 Tax=Selaginella moellendorffii TaxID=88036 RepID=D8SHS5_SELML|nr:uncharacterized protein LOC9662349 [Selaginella moellendorffii]EFJ16049.1 hypothetical protein SELMODRAFT_422224 [Selaginella moellendorffii]|eukprot:XP_002982804.1 uncharacterized protein LOC9662349 [Selaginella moellendorffii]